MWYKGAAAELDKENSLVESDIVATRSTYRGIKEELLKSEIARGVAEEAEKKVREDFQADRIRSHGLSENVDRLKRMLGEKEEAILQSGKMIEDLRVKHMDLSHSYKEIERANTDLVGENTALKEKIRGMFFVLLCFFLSGFFLYRLTLLSQSL